MSWSRAKSIKQNNQSTNKKISYVRPHQSPIFIFAWINFINPIIFGVIEFVYVCLKIEKIKNLLKKKKQENLWKMLAREKIEANLLK